MALNQTILPKGDRDTVIVSVYSLLAGIGATEINSDMIITLSLDQLCFQFILQANIINHDNILPIRDT